MKKLFSLLFLLCVSVISYAQIIEAVHWRFSVKDISDSEKELVFTANMDDGWHLYGMNIPMEDLRQQHFHSMRYMVRS